MEWHATILAALSAVFIVGCEPAKDRSDPASLDWHHRHKQLVAASHETMPSPPWPTGDEKGMANAIGRGTWTRCAHHLIHPDARVYELSHLRANDTPQSPWGPRLTYEWRRTSGIPGFLDAWHGGELVSGEPGAQGTQMDAFGHWGSLKKPWDGTGEFPADEVRYFGGYSQAEVKPRPDSPLIRLGIDKVPPIITSAVLLDARRLLGAGKPMHAGQTIDPSDIEAMLHAQGLSWRGILPGDVLYIHTGWSDHWDEDFYYDGGPGLSYAAAKFLESKRIVLVALDNPFTDAVNLGQFSGQAPRPDGSPENIYTPVHYHNLSQAGIHNIQNARLREMADDEVWLSCTMILPLRVAGGTGSPVRPVAIGAPYSQASP